MKRGQMEAVAKYILMIFILVVLLIFFYQIRKDLFVSPTEDIDCAAQVRASAMITDLREGKSAPDITCPTREVLFEAGVEDGVVFEELADEMKWCWDTWGKGELELFDEDGEYCHICSVARFEGEKQIPGFREYLRTTPVPKTEVNYVEYFAPQFLGSRFVDEGAPTRLREQAMLEAPIETENDYAIIFYYVRGEQQVKDFFIKMSQDAIDRPAAAVGAGGSAFLLGGSVAGGATFLAVCGLVTGSVCWWVVGGVAVASGVMAAVPTAYLAQEVADDPPHYMALLSFRPLNTQNIDELGCEYSFAARR